MRDGWEIRKLGDLAELQRGLTYSKGDEVPFSSKCVLRSNNIDLESATLDLTELKYLRDDFTIPEDRKVKKDSIFICMSNGSKQHVGKVAFIDTEIDYAFGGFMGLIVPRSGIVPKYVFYSCQSSAYRLFLSSIGNGIGITNLRFTDLANYSIPVPPIQEQEKIVAELDCLTGIIAKKKRQLKELDKLAQSIFYDMFGNPITNEKGWRVKLVREIASVKIGPFGSLLHAADYITGGCPVINPVHMREGRICAEADFTVSEEKRNVMSSYLLERDDIIFGRRGDIGRCALVSATDAGYICGTGSLFVRFTAPIIPIFALSVFMSNEMKDLLVGQAKGATMLNINCGIVEQLPIIFPPLDLQNEFAKKIEAIEKQKGLVKLSIAETEMLFNSRMDYWFN